jgi:hypothetical protein
VDGWKGGDHPSSYLQLQRKRKVGGVPIPDDPTKNLPEIRHCAIRRQGRTIVEPSAVVPAFIR